MALPPEVDSYYARGVEARRLHRGHGPLELARTRELLARYLPAPPAVVLDVGGGPGTYALELAQRGFTVHLVDASSLHVEQARVGSQAQPDHPLASVALGDAGALGAPDASADAVLLGGPLYHLIDRGERLAALQEARRVLRPGGVLVAVGVSRFAGLLDGLYSGYMADTRYVEVTEETLRTGRHRPPADREWFTTAYFHLPEELEAEVRDAGFTVRDHVGVEGPGWLVPDLAERWSDSAFRDQLMQAARLVEREASLRGVSAHLMVIGERR